MVEKFKNICKQYFSNGPKAAFIMSLVVVGIVITIISMRKTVIVVIDGKERNVVTYKRTIEGTLKENGIEVGQKDKVEPNLDSNIGNHDIINIKKAVNVEIKVDGQQVDILTAEEDIESMLRAEGINVIEEDKVLPSKDSKVQDGMEVQVVRVETKTLTETQPIDYNTVVNEDNNLGNNQTKIVQEGSNGERQVSTRVVYEDGKEVSKKIISENVVKQPTDKIVLQGTLGVLNLSRGASDQVLYKLSMQVRSTAYCNTGGNGNHITASGTATVRDPNGYSTIAVDPRVIPLGSKVYVEGYGYAVASDTGGAIKGNRIDLFFDSPSEVYDWGVKYVNIYVLK